MQPLKDYLNESPLQHESILDRDQNKVLGRMTDDMIRNRIREYCTRDRQKYERGDLWSIVREGLELTKIDKDEKGWYIETKSTLVMGDICGTMAKSFSDYYLSKGQKIDKQKGFLIEDIGVYFRWRKHEGELSVMDVPSFESTEGLPEELDKLYLFPGHLGKQSKRLEVRNKIKIIELAGVEDIKISGNGCKNIIINPDDSCGNVTAPNGVEIYRPKEFDEYWDLRKKLSH